MGYFGWKPYVPVAERRKQAKKAAAKMQKKGVTLTPVIGGRGSIAKTFWGKAWCDNLERYSDYDNRLPRGRTYVRNGSVIDLKITEGSVEAQVMGSSLYKVAVNIAAVPSHQWKAISADCAGSVASLVELLQGRLSKAVMERICTANTGLFPAPKEISFTCSCPDWASMCKHVAAVLYGIGVRMDNQPDLLFSLRRVDAKDLVAQAGTSLPKNKKIATTTKVLDASLLADVFGIEMADASPPVEHGKLTEKKKKMPLVKKTQSIRKPAIVKNAAVQKKPASLKKQVSLKKTATTKKTAKAQKTTASNADVGTVKVKSKSVVPKLKSNSVKKA
jgi:uncharacterized Zn finger protein